MKKILFLLFVFASLYSVAQVPDSSYTQKRYGNVIWVKYDTTAAVWDTLGIFPGATPEIWSSSGLPYVEAGGDTIYGNYRVTGVLENGNAVPSGICPFYGVKLDSGKVYLSGCSDDGQYSGTLELSTDTLWSGAASGYFSIIGIGETNPANCVSFYGATTEHKREGATTYDHRILYNMIASKTVANTTTPTSLFNDAGAIGTRTIPANFLKAGTTIRLHMRGDLSNTGNPTNTMLITLGGTTISSTTATLGAALTNSICEIEMDIVVRSIGSSGTVVAAGYAYVVSGITRSLLATTPITINTTGALALDVVYTWGAANAANTLTMLTGSIEILY